MPIPQAFNMHDEGNMLLFTDANSTCSDVNITELFDTHINNFVVAMIGALSITATSLLVLLMSMNKPLMNHPNKLIFGMCICEAAAAWHAIINHVGAKAWVCYFSLDKIYMNTVFWEQGELETLMMLEKNNYDILGFLEFFSLSLNFFLCLDIILTLRSPFSPHDRRMKPYFIGSFSIAILC